MRPPLLKRKSELHDHPSPDHQGKRKHILHGPEVYHLREMVDLGFGKQ